MIKSVILIPHALRTALSLFFLINEYFYVHYTNLKQKNKKIKRLRTYSKLQFTEFLNPNESFTLEELRGYIIDMNSLFIYLRCI